MLIIEIETTSIQTKAGNKNGKNWRIDTQPCLVHGLFASGMPTRFPRETSVQLNGDNAEPYPVGKYVLSPECYGLDQFGGLELRRVRLQSLSAHVAELQKLMPAKAS